MQQRGPVSLAVLAGQPHHSLHGHALSLVHARALSLSKGLQPLHARALSPVHARPLSLSKGLHPLSPHRSLSPSKGPGQPSPEPRSYSWEHLARGSRRSGPVSRPDSGCRSPTWMA